MSETKILPRSKMLELYDILNKENISNCKAIAIREIDISSLERMRSHLKSQGVRVSYSAFVAKAVAQTLKEMPNANRATIEAFFLKRIFQFKKIHVSFAVERNDSDAMLGGAFIYSVYDTDSKNLATITEELQGLSESKLESADPRLERWKKMKLGVQKSPFIWPIRFVIWLHRNIPGLYVENRGGAAMISSPSKYGVDFIVANWPYTIGISFGLAKLRPWVENGQLVVRKTMTMTLSFDRRLISGAQGARFMNRMCEILENAESFLADETPK